MTVKFQDVFVPGGFPSHTYNPRSLLKLEDRLLEVRNNLCKLAIVTGHTKSGKTVLARKVLPRQECIWIDGGTVAEEDDFWHVILEQLDLFNTTEESKSKESASTIGGAASGGLDLLIAKGSGEVSAEVSKLRSSGRARTRSVSARVAALRGLSATPTPIVVDDFHYLSKDLQARIVRALKQPIFDGLPVAIIAIPHRRYDAMKVEKEMTGRIYDVGVPVWTAPELQFIAETGFKVLGVSNATSISGLLAT